MSNLKGLIIDVDGTLANTEQDGHRVAFKKAFSDAGLDWYWDEDTYDELLAAFGGKERIRYYSECFLEHFNAPSDLDGFIRELHAHKTTHYAGLLESGSISLRIGAARLIREAQEAGLKMAIASMTTPENATTLLRQTLGEHWSTNCARNYRPAANIRCIYMLGSATVPPPTGSPRRSTRVQSAT